MGVLARLSRRAILIMDENPAHAQPPGRRFHIAGYTIARLAEGPHQWEVVARGLGVQRGSLLRALVDHTRWAGLPLYRLPGYGVVYRTVQGWLHRHRRCVLTQSRIGDPDGNRIWACKWCGHCIRERGDQSESALRKLSRLPPF